jgi:nitronate monooxygenase
MMPECWCSRTSHPSVMRSARSRPAPTGSCSSVQVQAARPAGSIHLHSLAGGIADGRALYAASVLGCDLAYMGTKFIATRESMADPRHKAMLVESSADDILLTTAFTGLQTNMLKPSIAAAGLNPADLPKRGAIEIGKDIDVGAREARPKRWRDIWSAGHSTSGVTDVPSATELIARTAAEYRACKDGDTNSIR